MHFILQLTTYISHQFNGIVWRMETDPITATLYAEIRNEQEKQVSFASVSLKSGNINFDHLLTQERWLTGIEAACNDILLLHTYQSASSPEHKGLIGINGITGQTLWHDYNQSFSHLSVKGPVIYDMRVQPRQFYIIDIKTGAIISTYNPSIDKDVDNKLVLPAIVTADTANLVELPEKPYGNIVHSVYCNGYRIVSLHAQKNFGLTQSLYIFNKGKQIFCDILNAAIQKLQPEAFVLHHHYLIYLKDRSKLNVINLGTE